MTFYVLATEYGDGNPSVIKIFSTEEAAIKSAKEYVGPTLWHDDTYNHITHQFDLNPDYTMYMHGTLQLGRAQEGGEIDYYRGLININDIDSLDDKERTTIKPI